MKVGLLAYHSACNFGAFLQLLSTVEYIRNNGDEPRVINWVPEDLERYYEKLASSDVRELFSKLREQFYPLTDLCRSYQDVARTIEEEHIDAVIVGSDAVCQHHPLRERIHFSTRRVFYVNHPTSDRMFPNVFWGAFLKYLTKPVPVALISGSSQDSKFKYIYGRTRRKMADAIQSFRFVSVRDDWTQKMFSYLTKGKVTPAITPDPVFAFNENASALIPSKEELMRRFSIPEDYFLLSFKNKDSADQKWITEFETLSEEQGIACVTLRYASYPAFGNCKYSLNESITPLEWYGLIKYSCGYIGSNMHPIVVSLHNGNPFFSFDNYGLKENETSSKIYHILEKADLHDYRVFIKSPNYIPPTPQVVLSSLLSFNREKAQRFSHNYYLEYQIMMEDVMKSLKNK